MMASSLNPPGGEGSASGSGSASAASSPSPPLELPQQSSQPPKRVQTNSGASQTGPAKRPLKQLGTHNQAYLELLNQQIIDAINGVYLEPQDMLPSQIGLIVWTTTEKEALYNALCRFGRYNTPAIAERIKTKTKYEVGAYLQLLEESCAKLVDNPENGDPEQPILSLPADIPAAAEISTDCCDTLEREADRLAILQEKQEQSLEKEWWGDDNWLITKANLFKMERMQGQLRKNQTQQPETVEEEEEEEDEASASVTTNSATTRTTAAKTKGKSADARSKDMPKLIKSLEFFKVKNLLELSERIFMNSARQEPDGSGNWVTMPTGMLEEENAAGTPAIRTSGLEDLYGIAVRMTEQIIEKVVDIIAERVNTREELGDNEVAKNVVYDEDVDYALAKLGLRSRGSRTYYWGDAPRRLGLHVVKGDTAPLAAAEEVELMDIEEVERALMPVLFSETELEDADEQEEKEEEDLMDTDGEEEEEEDLMDIDEQEEEEEEEEEEREINNEVAIAREVAHPFNIHPDVQWLLRTRIRAAREQEAYAERLDVKASAEEERRLRAFFESRFPSRSVRATQEGGDKNAEEEQIRPPPAMSGSVEELYEYLGDMEVFQGTVDEMHLIAAVLWELGFTSDSEGESMLDSEGEFMLDSEGELMLQNEGESMLDSEEESMLDSEGESMLENEGEFMLDSEGEFMLENEGEFMLDSEGESMLENPGEDSEE